MYVRMDVGQVLQEREQQFTMEEGFHDKLAKYDFVHPEVDICQLL